MRRRSAAVRALGLGLGLALFWAACSADDHGARRTIEAGRGPLELSVRAAGELRSVRSVDLVAPPGRGRLRIARLPPDGLEVRAGTPLVMFDAEEVAKELRDRQSDLGTASKELEQAGLEARAESERLAVEIERRVVQLDKARIRAGKDETLAAAHDIAKAVADVRAQEAALAAKRRARGFATERHEKQARSLKARIRKAEEDVKRAEERLAALSLQATVDGTVLLGDTWSGGTMRKFQVGDSAWSGQVIASLPDLSEMEVVLYVEEADIEAVRVGQPVRVRLDAAAERVFAGRVRSIPLLAESLSWRDPAKVFRVVAALTESDPGLMRPGLGLQAEVVVERHEDVISIPLELVAEVEGKTFVTLDSGEEVEVDLGPRNDDRVIVSDGLIEGARLVSPAASS